MKDGVYIEKRKWTDKLNNAQVIPGIESVEYRNISDKYSEYLRITFEGGRRIYIDVTGDSIEAMFKEVARACLGIRTEAEITHPTHVVLVEGWFDAAR